ncbi:TPA: hypothetical protein DEB00_01990 [Candidatus Uhrbacteria bacterium]|nr:hypothetical protein [Candidatus Uhrbacteria bacterium]
MFDRVPDKVYSAFAILLVVLPLCWFLSFLRESQRGYWYGIELDSAAQTEDALTILHYSWNGIEFSGKGPMPVEEITLKRNTVRSILEYKKHRAFIGLSDSEYYCYPVEPSFIDSALLGLIAERVVYRFSDIVAPANLVPVEVYTSDSELLRPHRIADYCRELYQGE